MKFISLELMHQEEPPQESRSLNSNLLTRTLESVCHHRLQFLALSTSKLSISRSPQLAHPTRSFSEANHGARPQADRAALVAIFARAFFPLLDVELEFLSLFGRVDVCFFGGGDGGACVGQLVVERHDLLRKSFDLGAEAGDLEIDSLEVDKARNCRMHEGLW